MLTTGKRDLMPRQAPQAPQALLFDLGGVLIDIDFERVFKVWEPISKLSLEEIRTRFGFDQTYQQHERGEIGASEFYGHLSAVLQLEKDHPDIARGWDAIFVGEIAETTAMVRAIRGSLPCYGFTNTNAAHMAVWSRLFPDVVNAFDKVFASHDIGLRKPEKAAFDHIANSISVPVKSILFFDDSLENINGANVAGLQTVHVRSPADVRQALQALGHSL